MSFCVWLFCPDGKLMPVALSFSPATAWVSVGPALALRPGVLLFCTIRPIPMETRTSGLDKTSVMPQAPRYRLACHPWEPLSFQLRSVTSLFLLDWECLSCLSPVVFRKQITCFTNPQMRWNFALRQPPAASHGQTCCCVHPLNIHELTTCFVPVLGRALGSETQPCPRGATTQSKESHT